MKKIICLYGGPGAGKSTLAAGLFYRLKCLGFTCEMNREYIKDWVWEERKIRPGDQTYYFAKQARKERVYMENGVDVIITDSPLILTHFYGLKYDHFEQTSNTSLVMLKHHHEVCKYYGFKVEHFVLNRTKAYDPKGRNQDEATAKQYDSEIQDMLDSVGIKYTKINANSGEEALNQIVEHLTMTEAQKVERDIDSAFVSYSELNPDADLTDLEAWIPVERFDAVEREFQAKLRLEDRPNNSRLTGFKTLNAPWGIRVERYFGNKIQIHPSGKLEANKLGLKAAAERMRADELKVFENQSQMTKVIKE